MDKLNALSKEEQELLAFYYIKQKKKKRIILVTLSSIIFLSFLVYIIVGIWQQTTWKPKEENIYIEYGQTKEIDISDFIDLNKYPELKNGTTIECDAKYDEKGYPKVGEYQVKITHKIKVPIFNNEINNEKSVRLIIKDTIPPSLKVPDVIVIDKGTSLKEYDFSSLIEAQDNSSEANYNVDFSQVDINIAGKYKIKVTAQDKYNNQTFAEFSCEVKEKEKVEQNVPAQDNGSEPVQNKPSGNKNTEDNKKPTKKDYPNKDFLFTDGYTMKNVVEAAKQYLYASGKSGRCVPIKDEEGIYLGMRVIFDE